MVARRAEPPLGDCRNGSLDRGIRRPVGTPLAQPLGRGIGLKLWNNSVILVLWEYPPGHAAARVQRLARGKVNRGFRASRRHCTADSAAGGSAARSVRRVPALTGECGECMGVWGELDGKQD